MLLTLDVASEDSVCSAIANRNSYCGKVMILVNNAGAGLAGPLEAAPMDDFEEPFQVNLFGAVRMIQAITPVFRNQKHGVIVNISSVVVRFGVPFMSPY
ncbi:SDR family NAD(P)-dependent oxidoreductase [Granulicella arctica]|uniref:SDR family NAD(P)-dependent oxidoreductase n=1 Tax=Granulicella arctica TaxID=940613 RepID=UPI0021DFBB57|nr:SDR family NAD(P)-dependent oxidoreductase [Granulicella arctica]